MTTDTVIEKKKLTSKRNQLPKKYKVIVCNDDVTPIDFVISMLMIVFKYNQDDAQNLTMSVHKQGSAIVGIYTYEIAEQKALDGVNLARANGWPLLIKVEEQ